MSRLVRLRADPAKVRVSIARSAVDETGALGESYVVTIAERTGMERYVVASSKTPRSAILRALLAAQTVGLVGIDMAMSSSYPHPQHIDVGTGYDVTLFPSVRQASTRDHGTRH